MDTPTTETHEVLVVQAQGGEEDAWATLVEHYQVPLWGYIARLTNSEIALDLLQDTLLKAWQGLCRNQPDQPRAFKPWVYRIARHTSLDWLRRQRLERRYHTSWEAQEEEEEGAPDVLEGVLHRDLVQRALQRIPLLARECLVLSDEQGFSPAEIAALFGGRLKESSIRTYISTARRLFQQHYTRLNASEERCLESEGKTHGTI